MLGRLAAHVNRNAYGLIAIFIALGGSAYAAATIGADDIKDNAVRSKHVKDGQIKGDDLASPVDESLSGAILISDQDGALAGQGGPKTIGEIPGVGHFEATCSASAVSAKFISEFGGGSLAVWTDFGPDDALYEEIANGVATSAFGTGGADATGKLLTYRIHRARTSAPELETPKATVTLSLQRRTPTIPDACVYTVQGIAQP